MLCHEYFINILFCNAAHGNPCGRCYGTFLHVLLIEPGRGPSDHTPAHVRRGGFLFPDGDSSLHFCGGNHEPLRNHQKNF